MADVRSLDYHIEKIFARFDGHDDESWIDRAQYERRCWIGTSLEKTALPIIDRLIAERAAR